MEFTVAQQSAMFAERILAIRPSALDRADPTAPR
jgi:hypothetical protein